MGDLPLGLKTGVSNSLKSIGAPLEG